MSRHAGSATTVALEVPPAELAARRRDCAASEPGRGTASARLKSPIEQLDDVDHLRRVLVRPLRRANLQDAARVRRDHEIDACLADVRGLPAAQLTGHLRLHQVEDAGAAAADLWFGERHEGDAGNRLKQRARFGPDALCVREMTGVV